MTFKTWNTLYTLRDMGDGAFLISGHERFCPVPTRVTLDSPPEVGTRVRYTFLDPPPFPGGQGGTVTSTPVVEVSQ